MSNLFKTKQISTEELQSSKLKRTLTATNLVALGIGAVIGAGIFVITGTAAAEHAGPAIVISFIMICFVVVKIKFVFLNYFTYFCICIY